MTKIHRKLVLACAAALVVAIPANGAVRCSSVLWTGAATDTTAVGMADSSAVVFTGNCGRLYLWLKPSLACRVAIQVRAHGDSIAGSGAPALTDSTKAASWFWRAHVGAAATLNNTTDSTVWIHITSAVSSVLAGEDEYVVHFVGDEAAVGWGGPRAKWIALAKVDNGEPYWGPHTSIRLRVLTADGVVTWTGSLQGYGP